THALDHEFWREDAAVQGVVRRVHPEEEAGPRRLWRLRKPWQLGKARPRDVSAEGRAAQDLPDLVVAGHEPRGPGRRQHDPGDPGQWRTVRGTQWWAGEFAGGPGEREAWHVDGGGHVKSSPSSDQSPSLR